ncbi:MAG: FAD-binding oxidoreductase, partial [Flavobacteriaceae bacterium]|nr:FAD-binding oxidoreductase [Flavobacteriaceae bacterium]
MSLTKKLKTLSNSLNGELFFDNLHKTIYATDASVYRKIPLAVSTPKTIEDIQKLISFTTENNTTLIPRAAGTSLAGQCVGDGIVVDISKHFTKIISFNKEQKTITVQPGIIRDELNHFLKPHGLFFSPNTSTSNRCMIGGMVGNNSSGTTSIQYGVTRDKVLKLKTILSDGSDVIFEELTPEEFQNKVELKTLEGHIYKTIHSELILESVQNNIKDNFPKPIIHRRNTGYAIDELIKNEVFINSSAKFN